MLKGYKVIEHTNNETDYEYLEDGDILLEVINPYSENSVYIELSGEFSLFFEEWHSHYLPYETEYFDLKSDLQGILNGENGALVVYSSKRWLGSTLHKGKISHSTNKQMLLPEIVSKNEFMNEIKSLGGKLTATYWNPIDDCVFEIPKEDSKINTKES